MKYGIHIYTLNMLYYTENILESDVQRLIEFLPLNILLILSTLHYIRFAVSH